jgi:hypothetical protein
MIKLKRNHKIAISIVIVGLTVLVGVVSFTNVCSIQAVTLNGKNLTNWYENSTLDIDKSVLKQPLAEFIEHSLDDDKTLKVDISYSWPHTLNVELNSISPACLIIDSKSGNLYGLDDNCRIIPLKDKLVDWERPLFTGIEVKKLYDFCSDVRSRSVIEALGKIRKDRINFYRLIEEIDFSTKDFLQVTIAGHDHTIRLRSQYFFEDINRYVDFAARYNLRLDSIRVIDLRQSGQIVAKGRRG